MRSNYPKLAAAVLLALSTAAVAEDEPRHTAAIPGLPEGTTLDLEFSAGWGFFDYRRIRERFEDGFQSLPVDWSIRSDRKRAFFALVKEVTGA